MSTHPVPGPHVPGPPVPGPPVPGPPVPASPSADQPGGQVPAGVAAALARLDELEGRPVGEHVEVFDGVHRLLQDSLATLDEA